MRADFDERQMQIRGQVFFHGFIAALVLLLINAALQSNGVVWASGFHQNVILMVFISTITAIEATIRGVYFGNGKTRWIILGMFGLLSIFLWVLNIQHIIQGSSLFEDRTLTSNGFSVALAIMFSLTTVVGLIIELRDKRKDSD